MRRVWIVQCAEDSGGYVLHVYDNEKDAVESRQRADMNSFCARHTVLLKWVADSEGT